MLDIAAISRLFSKAKNSQQDYRRLLAIFHYFITLYAVSISAREFPLSPLSFHWIAAPPLRRHRSISINTATRPAFRFLLAAFAFHYHAAINT